MPAAASRKNTHEEAKGFRLKRIHLVERELDELLGDPNEWTPYELESSDDDS